MYNVRIDLLPNGRLLTLDLRFVDNDLFYILTSVSIVYVMYLMTIFTNTF
jgi:hypothetical protein